MSVPGNFSHENDEHGVSPQQGPYTSTYQAYNPHSYQDSPPRDIISPPPQYSSPPPPSHPRAPSPARSHHLAQNNYNYTPSRDVQRRPIPSPYHDQSTPPAPPPHRSSPTTGLQRLETSQAHGFRPTSIVTPGGDNFSDRAQGGGLNSVAQGVADAHQRESGLDALRAIHPPSSSQSYHHPDRDYHNNAYDQPPNPRLPDLERSSYGSNLPLAAGAATPGSITPIDSPDHRARYSSNSIPLDDYPNHDQSHGMTYQSYQDSPYHNSSRSFNPAVTDATINPNSILDDGDDGFLPDPQRKSVFPISRERSKEHLATGTAPPAATAASGAMMGGLFGKKAPKQPASAAYDPVSYDGADPPAGEKSGWLSHQRKGNKKMRWMVGVAIGAVIVLALIAGIVGGVLGSHTASSSGGGGNGNGAQAGSTNNAATDLAANGDLDIHSKEIQALMNNKNLHKVFPAIDYTPWGTQYPLCDTYPPSPNNVTRDMAVLSQLTNTVRLYGTDCNQTEMVLRSISRLQLTNMKVWMGVWIDTNTTTTERQLKKMYEILASTPDLSIFKGVIVGNEALYRAGVDKAQSEQTLINYLTDVRSQFKTKGYNLPIATSDLGDNWNGQLVQAVDYVMSNIHPFFAGVTAQTAAAWTWNFWEQHDVVLTANLPKVKQVISETGWPSEGGEDCGVTGQTCAPGQSGAVASIPNMNTFMNDWVCQALANGTDYFWFEAFDEPWKVIYNTASQNWEDKWGLMDPGRNLKTGLKIPDCGGKTVS